MSKNLLSSQQAKTIDPDEITLVFPDNKPAKWRRDIDTVSESPDTDPHYDKRVLLAVPSETIVDYKEIGVIEPALLYQYEGRIYCADGIQRTKGLRIANAELEAAGETRRVLPYIFISYQEAKKMLRVRTSLNFHRTDDTPPQKAELALRLLALEMTEAEVAVAMRTSVQSIRDYKRYMQAPPEALKAVTKNEIAFTTVLGWQKDKIAPEEQVKLVGELKEATAGRTTLAGTPKKASASEAKQVAKQRELTPEQATEQPADNTKTIAKIYRLLEEVSAAERLTIFAKYGPDGEEKPIVSHEEIEAQNQSLEIPEEESEVSEFKIELDADAAPKAASRKAKRAGKK